MKFSVVIPSYNREKVILRAINSVLKQTCQDFEIVVVDDGSNDNTRDVVSSINDGRVKYVYQDNQGATAARNNGIIHSDGEYISFLDSDDIWYPEMLSKQLSLFESDKEIGWVYTNVQGILHDGSTIPFGIPLGIHGNIYSEALKQGYVAPTTVISAKKEAIYDVGMFDVNLPASQDDDFCFKLAKKYKVGYIPDPMAGMFFDPDNRISNNKKKVALGWWMLWNKYEEDVIKFCGSQTICAHYKQCMKRFANLQDMELYDKVYKRFILCGGKLNTNEKIKMKLRGGNFYKMAVRLYSIFVKK